MLLDREAYWRETGVMSYRPLGVLVGMVYDVRLVGLSPAWSHLLNMVLHGLNAWLLFVLLAWGAGRGGWMVAAGGAGVFAVHPLVTEVVYCAGFRFDLLALFFVLGGVVLAAMGVRGGYGGWRLGGLVGGSAGCLALGLLSKEIAAVGVLMGPLYVGLLLGRWRLACVLAVVYTGVFAGFLVVWRWFQFPDYPSEFLGGGGRVLGMANFVVSFVEIYLAKFFWPWPLRVDYAFEPAGSLGSWRVLGAFAVVLVLGAGLAAAGWRSGVLGFGAVWLVVGFAPLAQLTPVPDPVAERFCYVPMVGVAFVVAGVLGRWAPGGGASRWVAGVVLAVLVAWGAVSHRRGLDWRDDERLNVANWEQAGDRRPVALEALGALYLGRAGRLGPDSAEGARAHGKAMEALERLTREAPEVAGGWRLRAVGMLMAGRMEEARVYTAEALARAPEDPLVAALAGRFDPPVKPAIR